MWQNLSSAAVVIGAFRVKLCPFNENRELSGRVLDSRPRVGGLEPYWCYCVVLEKDILIFA